MKNTSIKEDLSLKKYHISLFFIHFIQSSAILFLAHSFTVPIVTTFYYLENKLDGIFSSDTNYFTISLVVLIWSYLMITAFFHLILINNKIYNWYIKHLHNRINYLR